MSRKLEKFIQENKKAFDTELPSIALWEKIERDLNKKKVNDPARAKLWIGIAASITVALCLLLYLSNRSSSTSNVAELNPDYAQKQVRFASLIERKTDSLEVLATENPDLYRQFSTDLQGIKSDYKHLNKQLSQSANQKLVIKAMEKNLELQVKVLSQQLTIINQVNQLKKDNQL